MERAMDEEFAADLERYLRQTLHDDIDVKPSAGLTQLPVFVERLYTVLKTRIAGRRCLILATENPATPFEIGKHVSLVRTAVDGIVVFAAPSVTAHNRSRLIDQGISFIVPGNQLYIPDLAIDLREHFRTFKSRHAKELSPAAQAVLFHHILHLDARATTPSAIAEHLHYSAMSIGRAFDDFVALKLAKTQRLGKEKHLKFNVDSRKLFESARTLLRSPVRSVKPVRHIPTAANLKRAGESALSELTDLSKPKTNTYAIAASNWQSFAKAFNLVEVDKSESDIAIETWSYDPAGLSVTAIVDPLSLYAQFSGHRDERVSMAAEKLLERIQWS
jgi:hypothetical protein